MYILQSVNPYYPWGDTMENENKNDNKEKKDQAQNKEEPKRNYVRPEERYFSNGEFIGPNTYKSKEMH